MKIRIAFISNSSVSSFVCDVCGATEAGHDCSPRDLGFISCENGHILCEEHRLDLLDNLNTTEIIQRIKNNKYIMKWVEDIIADEEDFVLEECDIDSLREIVIEGLSGWDSIDILSEECPICMFAEPDHSLIKRYLQKIYGVSEDTVFEEIKKFNKRRKKLYDYEYIHYVCQKENLTVDGILTELKEKYRTFENFIKCFK